MSRTILALPAMGALGAPFSASAASDRACLGQTLKTDVGTADFGRSTRARSAGGACLRQERRQSPGALSMRLVTALVFHLFAAKSVTALREAACGRASSSSGVVESVPVGVHAVDVPPVRW
jgi:hypothetical protein